MNEIKITAQKGAIVNMEDRLALASLLLKHGYTVRIGKEKADGKSTTTTYIAYAEAEK
jgi:hypothetical protein